MNSNKLQADTFAVSAQLSIALPKYPDEAPAQKYFPPGISAPKELSTP